jgi:hypothetical protein
MDCDKLLSDGRPTSRVVLNACPATGSLDLMGVNGTEPATGIFTLSDAGL